MTTRGIRKLNWASLVLAGAAALCAACSPMRQQLDGNPNGYIVSSYNHRGATDGEGSQVFAMSTNPAPDAIEAGAVYLESRNGGDYSIRNTYAHPSHRASAFTTMNTGGWSAYTAHRGSLLLNAPGSLNNHLIVLTPPPRLPASRYTGAGARPSGMGMGMGPSNMSRPATSPSARGRAMAPAQRSIPVRSPSSRTHVSKR